MEFPRSAEPARESEWNVGRFGTWIFLASELMLFGALFAVYVALRVTSPDWPAGSDYLDLRLGLLNTVVLITSSVTMVLAWVAVSRDDLGRFRSWMGLTVGLGVLFMIVKYAEFFIKFHQQHYPYTNTFLGVYFSMTVIHSIHVLGGITINAWLWGPGSKLWDTEPQRFTDRVENAGLFWHLVDLVWLALFPTLYLL